MSAMMVRYNDSDLTDDEQFDLMRRISLSNRIQAYVRNNGALKIAFVVPMTSIRKTFKAVFKASKGTGLKQSMVIGPQDVMKENEKYDIVFVDESHRLSRRHSITSYGSFDAACAKLGINKNTSTQLDMIQLKSKYSVLVYDENQTIKASDITHAQFNEAVNKRDRFHQQNLTSQMRYNGGATYIKYLDDIFNISDPTKIEIDNYDFQIWDNPNNMINDIQSKDTEIKLCRIVASYSWEWISKDCRTIECAIKNGLEDIELDGKKYVWNMSNQEWILRSGAVNEIGCVHTTQGYDLNYVAVIFGNRVGGKRK